MVFVKITLAAMWGMSWRRLRVDGGDNLVGYDIIQLRDHGRLDILYMVLEKMCYLHAKYASIKCTKTKTNKKNNNKKTHPKVPI